jgi:hypothetical protein
MMLHKIRIALAVTLLALAAVSAVDSASAQSTGDVYGLGSDNVGYLPNLHSPLALLMRSARL